MCHSAVMICVMLCLSLSHTAELCVVYHTGVVNRGVVDRGVVDRGVLWCAVKVFRALRVSLGCNDLCDVLSRLVETVAEQGEDMQVFTLCSVIVIAGYD